MEFDVKHKYRTTFDDLAEYYSGSARNAFEDGNYAYSAHIADTDSDLKACSLIMLGNPEMGIELMQKLPQTPEIQFYRAVGNWFLGNQLEVNQYLLDLDVSQLSSAQNNCLELLGETKINVLVINREFNTKAFTRNSQFNLMTMGFSPSDDISLTLSDDKFTIMEHLKKYSFVPDILVVYRPEYLLLPIGFEEFDCPKIAFVSDYDLHVYQKYSDFMKFDAFVVYSGVDHHELSKLTEKPVFTHILSHSIYGPSQINNIPFSNKQFDIHVTGSSFRRFFADKSALLFYLTQLDNHLKIKIEDGFVSPIQYAGALRNVRIVPTFVRFYGCFPTRGVEALEHGASILYQEGGVLESFIDPESFGIYSFPDNYDFESLQQIVNCALENQIKCDRKLVGLDKFYASRSVPMFLKFCSIVTRLKVKKPSSKQNIKPRYDVSVVGIDDLHGGIAGGLTGEEHCRNFARMIEYNLQLSRTPQSLNSAAILSVYWLLHLERYVTWYKTGTKERLLEQAVKIWTEACQLFPNHLVVKFNLARFYYHYEYTDEATVLLQEIVDNYCDTEIVPLHDDIMSALFFFEDFFPYKEYIDLIIKQPHNKSMCKILKSIIASASAWYLSIIYERRQRMTISYKFCELALEIYPDNQIAKKGFTSLLIKNLSNDASAEHCYSLIKNFESSVSDYVLNLHDGFSGYIDLLVRTGQIDSAKSALNAWFNFFSRVRKNGELLHIDVCFINNLLKYSELLPDRARKLFSVVLEFTKTGKISASDDDLIEELFLVLTKNVNFLNLLVSGIYSGSVILMRKNSFRIVANRLLKSGQRKASIYLYFKYIRIILSISEKHEFSCRLNEILECIADILQMYPRGYLVARLIRLRVVQFFRHVNG